MQTLSSISCFPPFFYLVKLYLPRSFPLSLKADLSLRFSAIQDPSSKKLRLINHCSQLISEFINN